MSSTAASLDPEDTGEILAAMVAPAETESIGPYSGFLEFMNELGLLKDLEEELPDGFSAVYEIARILTSSTGDVSQQLGAALELAELDETDVAGTSETPWESRIEVAAGEEYEAEFIRTWSDVQRVYAGQFLLPEEEFLRRLANRTLWFPMAKAPTIRAIHSGEDDYSPNPSKQKVYVLLDTSTSMRLKHRFAFAKAIALTFLRRNRSELGQVFLRTFDVDVGPSQSAESTVEYDALLKRVARQHLLGNGTCLERAILRACEDIHRQRVLAGAEILVITDGAAKLDEAKVAAALGNRIRLHCVKLGHATVYASDKYLDEMLDYGRSDGTRRDQKILQVRDRKRRLEMALEVATDVATKKNVEAALRDCAAERKTLGEEIRADYGHEIERLAHVYVEVPDLDPRTVFRIGRERLESLRMLVKRVKRDLDESPAQSDALKSAALLLSHLALLTQEQLDPETKRELEELRKSLESKLQGALEYHEQSVKTTGLLTMNDQRDLRVLLRRGSSRYSSLWLLLLRYFYQAVTRLGRR